MSEQFEQIAEGATELRLEIHRGDVSVRAAEGERWHLEWDSDQGEVPEVSRDGDLLRIKHVRHEFMHAAMDVRLVAPATLNAAHVSTGFGDVEAEGLNGRIHVASGHGDVEVRRAGGQAEVRTGNGDLEIEGFAGTLRASSGNGDVEVRDLRGDAEVHSGNGDVTVDVADGRVTARTGRGDVEVRASGAAAVTAETGLGDVEVRGGDVSSLFLRTGKGDVSARARLGAGRHDLQSGFGAVEVFIPADAKVRINAQTGAGDVESDFPLVRVGKSGPMGFGGVRMVGSIGEGEPDVDLSLKTGWGGIAIRRDGEAQEPAGPASRKASRGAPFGAAISSIVRTALEGAMEGAFSHAEQRHARWDERRAEREQRHAERERRHAEREGWHAGHGHGAPAWGQPPPPPVPPTPPGPAAPPPRPEPATPAPSAPEAPAAREEAPPPRPSEPAAPTDPSVATLEALARGEISVDEAQEMLSGNRAR